MQWDKFEIDYSFHQLGSVMLPKHLLRILMVGMKLVTQESYYMCWIRHFSPLIGDRYVCMLHSNKNYSRITLNFVLSNFHKF